jgi:hypothetical protein
MRVYSLRSDSIIAWINSSVCYIVYCSFTLIYIKKDKLINFRINGKLTISTFVYLKYFYVKSTIGVYL